MEKNSLLRKVTIAFLAFAGVFAGATAQRISTTPSGDANLDFKVNEEDVTTAIDSILRGHFAYWCYVNFDEMLNASDVASIVNINLGNTPISTPTYSGTLPTVFINTENKWGVITKEEYIKASMYIVNPDGTMFASPESPTELNIRGRGNSTWRDVVKKPYKLKFPEKTALLGMKKNKHFTLLPHYLDWWGYLQNPVGFRLSEKMGLAYTTHQKPVEVVMNGAYIGIYFLTEQIKVGKNRVNITEQNDYETDSLKVTGGWLLEIENYPDSLSIPIYEHDNRENQNLYFTSHSPELLSSEQFNYIKNFLEKTDSAIYCGDPDSREWEKYIDMESLAKFYIVNEIVDNKEAFSGSCWMSKEMGDSTKLVFGPVWDFGSSFATWKAGSDTCFHSFIYENLPHYANTHWIKEICKYPRFQEMVKKLWKEFYANEYEGIIDYINNFVVKIKDAADHDFIRWPKGCSDVVIARKDQFYLPSIKAKVKWLQQQWGEE